MSYAFITAAIQVIGGIVAFLVGSRLLGPKPGQDAKFDETMKNWGWALRLGGPILILFGVASYFLRTQR